MALTTTDESTKNRRIVKNTLYMYLRMLVMMLISLYTSRVILQNLGVDNFGIYNIVGGIIVFFSFLNNGLSLATRRYITADIEGNDLTKSRQTFTVCFQAHLIVALIVLVLAELIGPYVIYEYLNIPEGREFAAQVVFQISVFTAVLGILMSPLGTSIVAYEKMDIYAYFTIVDVILKLGIVFLLQYIQGDKLIIYALLLMGVSLINMGYYGTYSLRRLPACRFLRYKNLPMLRAVFSFMGWNLLGQSATVATNQGVSVLVNLYFNVAANAAMGVSNSITSIVSQFVSNFQTAFNPQIIKSYNTGDYHFLKSLIIRATKISSYLVMIFLIPLVFDADRVLTIWLGEYPTYAVEFCIYTLCCMYLEAISAPLYMVIYSQSRIRKYQVIISFVYSLCFFLGWGVLALGALPYSVIIVRFVVFAALLAVRLYFVKQVFSLFDFKEWAKEILCKGAIIFMVASCVVGIFASWCRVEGWIHVILTTCISLAMCIPLMYFVGLSKREKLFVKNAVVNKIKKNV